MWGEYPFIPAFSKHRGFAYLLIEIPSKFIAKEKVETLREIRLRIVRKLIPHLVHQILVNVTGCVAAVFQVIDDVLFLNVAAMQRHKNHYEGPTEEEDSHSESHAGIEVVRDEDGFDCDGRICSDRDILWFVLAGCILTFSSSLASVCVSFFAIFSVQLSSSDRCHSSDATSLDLLRLLFEILHPVLQLM